MRSFNSHALQSGADLSPWPLSDAQGTYDRGERDRLAQRSLSISRMRISRFCSTSGVGPGPPSIARRFIRRISQVARPGSRPRDPAHGGPNLIKRGSSRQTNRDARSPTSCRRSRGRRSLPAKRAEWRERENPRSKPPSSRLHSLEPRRSKPGGYVLTLP
jgi:hypothetical protein